MLLELAKLAAVIVGRLKESKPLEQVGILTKEAHKELCKGNLS